MFKTSQEFLDWAAKKNVEERNSDIKDRFRNLKPFEKVEDIPRLPVTTKDEWNSFYIPILIEKGAIPKNDLEDGIWYIGDHRRCRIAKWNKGENRFGYIRNKFGNFFWDKCNHFQDDDGFALFVPIGKATKEEIDSQEKV